MPRTVTISCPDCDKQVKAPAEIVGKKIRCKACGAAFTAREAEELDEIDEVEDLDEAEEEAPKKKPAKKKPEAKKPEPKKEEPKKKPAGDDDEAGGYGITALEEGNRCPDCANEMLDEEAIICVYCGYNTMTRERKRTRKVVETTQGDTFMWLLPGILSAVGGLLIITWIIIHWTLLEGWLYDEQDKEAWYLFIVHLSMKIWFTVPMLFLLYHASYFAINRLAINNQPPEVEKKV
ncbi:MAG: hypothetical protein K2W96_03950 [Gemmataceae bacterium]|nr:hypothetical protein [Gemmataceae bacterium]